MSEPVLCHLCQRGLPEGEDWIGPRGLAFCRSDPIGCNFRARRRLGIPLHVCFEWRAREEGEALRLKADRAEADSLAAADFFRELRVSETSLEYRAYLRSPAWERRRDQALLDARYRCQDCGRVTWELDVHHLTYERLGEELPGDLIVLCKPCHEKADTERRLEQWRLQNPGKDEGRAA